MNGCSRFNFRGSIKICVRGSGSCGVCGSCLYELWSSPQLCPCQLCLIKPVCSILCDEFKSYLAITRERNLKS